MDFGGFSANLDAPFGSNADLNSLVSAYNGVSNQTPGFVNPILPYDYGEIVATPSQFSTPVQSPTPATGGGNFLSSIFNGIGGTLQTAIPQFTSSLIQAGGQKLIADTFKGGTKTPTTAQTQSNSSILSNPTTWIAIGGLVVAGVVIYMIAK